MILYRIKNPEELLPSEIAVILMHWEVDAWLQLSAGEFKGKFAASEFHLLTDENLKILCLSRINFDFKIRLQEEILEVAELVGLVAIEKGKGYGKRLMQEIVKNLKNRQIEAIGFCEKINRPFYLKCQLPVLVGKAKQLREPNGDKWLIPEDDDIIILNLSEENSRILQSLNPEKPGYLVFS